MIKFQDIKKGDYVLAEQDGTTWAGEVMNLNGDEKEICVDNGVQGFWFKPEELRPLPLDDEQLMKLNFQREVQEDGSVKYKKGAFRMLIPKADDFSHMDVWYRDDKRINPRIEFIHQLQNHYLQMTKVHLTKEPIA